MRPQSRPVTFDPRSHGFPFDRVSSFSFLKRKSRKIFAICVNLLWLQDWRDIDRTAVLQNRNP
jgi:hypothetical protein